MDHSVLHQKYVYFRVESNTGLSSNFVHQNCLLKIIDIHPSLLSQRANNSSSYNAEDIKTDDAAGGFYPTSNMADFALPFSLSGMWKKKADVLPPETLHQLEMMRRAEEIKQQNAHVKENLATATAAKPKPASRKRRDAERAAAKAQQQVRIQCGPVGLNPEMELIVEEAE